MDTSEISTGKVVVFGAGGIAAGCLLGMYLNKDYKSLKEFYLAITGKNSESTNQGCGFDENQQKRADLSCASDPDTPTKIYADLDKKGGRYSALEAFPDVSKNRYTLSKGLSLKT